jgi:hypothetical protein
VDIDGAKFFGYGSNLMEDIGRNVIGRLHDSIKGRGFDLEKQKLNGYLKKGNSEINNYLCSICRH